MSFSYGNQIQLSAIADRQICWQLASYSLQPTAYSLELKAYSCKLTTAYSLYHVANNSFYFAEASTLRFNIASTLAATASPAISIINERIGYATNVQMSNRIETSQGSRTLGSYEEHIRRRYKRQVRNDTHAQQYQRGYSPPHPLRTTLMAATTEYGAEIW